jgi:hypothetical protein
MVDDFISSKILLGKNKTEIYGLLGILDPVNTYLENDVQFYHVMEKYKWNVDPYELIYLEVSLRKRD